MNFCCTAAPPSILHLDVREFKWNGNESVRLTNGSDCNGELTQTSGELRDLNARAWAGEAGKARARNTLSYSSA